MIDSLVLGSLWGVLREPQVCTSIPHIPPPVVSEGSWVLSPVGVTAFVNVNVVPMDTEQVLPDQTVLVENQRITALGPSSKIKVPAGAVRIDGQGKYLMPGLGDMHWHASAETYDQRRLTYLAGGITSIRNLAESQQTVRPFDPVAVPGPRLYTSFTGDLQRPDNAAAYIAAQKAAGYDFLLIPRTTKGTRKSLVRGGFAFPRLRGGVSRSQEEQILVDSLLAAARRLNFPVASHEHEPFFDETLALGAVGGSSEHLFSYLRALVKDPEWQAVDVPVSEMQTLAATAQRAGVWLTPTLNCIKHVSTITPLGLKLMRQFVKVLHDAGVGLLLASDGGPLHDELVELVGAGLSPYQALLTGTRNVAAFFKILDSSGTVTVGKRADLILLGGNPLQDVGHTREPAGVMIAGRWFDRAELDRLRRTP